DPQQRQALPDALLKLLGVLGATVLAELAMRRVLRRPRDLIARRTAASFWLRAMLLCGRALLQLIPILVFGAAGWCVVLLAEPDAAARIVALALIDATVIVRGLLVVGRQALAPEPGATRLVVMREETAHYWLVWLRRLAGLVVYGYFAAEAAMLLGIEPGALDV